MTSRLMLSSLAALLVLAWPCAAWSQGRGNAYGRANNMRPPVAGSVTSPAPAPADAAEIHLSGTGFRNFGASLDDASMLPARSGFVSLGFGISKMPGYREIDVPMIDTAVGVHRRMQLGLSLPYFHVNEPGGPMARGLGTIYVSTKLQLRDPTPGGVGLSVSPMLEWLSAAPDGSARAGWALPVNVEVQRASWRTYASTGYFSRGALFASAALERAVSQRTWITGTVSRSYSVRDDHLSAALGLARSRMDVGAGVTFAAAPGVALFGSVGRTISMQDAHSSVVAVGAGVSFAFDVR